VSAFTIDVTCPLCGSDVELVTQGKPKPTVERQALVRCTKPGVGGACCAYQFLISLKMSAAWVDDEGYQRRCGTDGGYAAHRRRGEAPCTACTVAHTDVSRQREQRRRKVDA
jgi:hypothetical protein